MSNTLEKTPYRRKHHFDEHYFNVIDTEAKAYYLGLLYADGCNHANKSFCIQLEQTDKDIIERFKSELAYTGPLYKVVKKKIHYGLFIHSVYTCNRLNELGVVPRKTFLIKEIPSIPTNLINHFIRGYFDGDGCIRVVDLKKWGKKTRLRFCLTGTELFLRDVQKVLIKEAGLSITKLSSYKHSIIKSLEYSGNGNGKKLYDYLYRDATFFLRRKKNKFEEGLALCNPL